MARGSKLYRLEGIILSRRDHGEADRIVRVLSEDGWIDLLAKGTRKPRSRKAGHLEMFSKSQLLISRVKNSWDIVSQAEALVVRHRLQEDFQRGTYARYVAELVVRFFQVESDPALYTLVDTTLGRLETTEDPELLVRWHEQHLLSLAGFQPEWDACVGEKPAGMCHAHLRPKPDDRHAYGVDPEHGGALCPDCFVATQGMRTVSGLSPSALSWLQALQRRPYDELAQFPMPQKTRAELARAMEHYIAYHLERRPTVSRLMRQ